MARTARIIALGLASLGLVGSSLVAAAPAFGRDHSRDGYREVSGEACLHDWNHRQCKSRTDLEADVRSSHRHSDWKVVKLSVDVDFFKRHDNRGDRCRWDSRSSDRCRNNGDRCRWDSRSSDRCGNNGDRCRWDSRSSDRCGNNNGGDKCRWDSRSSDRCGNNNGGDKCRWDSRSSDRCGNNNGGDKCRWDSRSSDKCGNNNGGDKCRWTNSQGGSDKCGMKPGSNDPNGGQSNGPTTPSGPPTTTTSDPTTTTSDPTSTTTSSTTTTSNSTPTTPDTTGQNTGQNNGQHNGQNNNTTTNQSSGLPANSQACDNPGRRHNNGTTTNGSTTNGTTTNGTTTSTAAPCQTAPTGQSVSRGTSRSFHRDHVDSRDLGEVKFQYWNDRRHEWVTFAKEDVDSHGKADVTIKVNLKKFHDHELKVRAKYSGVEDRIDGSTSDTVTID